MWLTNISCLQNGYHHHHHLHYCHYHYDHCYHYHHHHIVIIIHSVAPNNHLGKYAVFKMAEAELQTQAYKWAWRRGCLPKEVTISTASHICHPQTGHHNNTASFWVPRELVLCEHPLCQQGTLPFADLERNKCLWMNYGHESLAGAQCPAAAQMSLGDREQNNLAGRLQVIASCPGPTRLSLCEASLVLESQRHNPSLTSSQVSTVMAYSIVFIC